MCYRPIKIINSAKHLFPASRFEVNVPCGCCFQCQKQKSLEYEMRSYYEFIDCLQKGGFVYTDCLTYTDIHLPHLSQFINYIPDEYDYPCFSYVDFRLFMVRLRQNLREKGFDVKKTLRYFMASEYGTSLSGTHRPHYHIIFYCTTPNLTSYDLSKAVSEVWHYGRTDGVPYQSVTYINKHTYSGVVADGDILKTISYISKYVAKQSFYNKLVFKRFSNIVKYFGYDERSDEYKMLFKDIKKYSFQFHRQSSGFGLSALGSLNNTIEDIEKNGCFIYKSLKSSVLKVPIPMYFQRKLFYDLIKSIDGSLHWSLNDKGVNFKQKRLPEVVNEYALNIESFYFNLNEQHKSYFDYYLNNRSFKDFAEYILIYKGRLKSDAQLLREKQGVFVADDPYIFHSLTLQPLMDTVFFNRNTSTDKKSYGVGFISSVDPDTTKYFPNAKRGYFKESYVISKHLKHLNTIYPCFDVSKHLLNNIPFCFTNKSFLAYLVTEHSDPRFARFDQLFEFMCEVQCAEGAPRQAAFDTIQRLSSIYKQFYK